MVEQSQTLNTPGAEQKSKRDLFVSLKHELEWVIITVKSGIKNKESIIWFNLLCLPFRGPVLDRASKAAWELILSKEGIGKEIMETVFRAYNQLHGKETTVYSPPDSHTPLAMHANELQTQQSHGVGHLNGQAQDLNHTSVLAPKFEE